MLDSEKFAIAARLHVMLRRKAGRVTDVEWMVKNEEYAQELLRFADEQGDAELSELADKFRHVGQPSTALPTTEFLDTVAPELAGLHVNPTAGASKYVESLR